MFCQCLLGIFIDNPMLTEAWVEAKSLALASRGWSEIGEGRPRERWPGPGVCPWPRTPILGWSSDIAPLGFFLAVVLSRLVGLWMLPIHSGNHFMAMGGVFFEVGPQHAGVPFGFL